jgi:hypothetical protein
MVFAPRVISSRLNLQPNLLGEKPMRKFRQLSMAVVLTFALGTFALAGTVETPPGTVETPPAPHSATATGIIGTSPSDAQSLTAATDAVVDAALNLLQSVLSLF